MNPGDGAWWWQHGLDGVVGGVIGGAVTGLVVWLTLRHERHLAEDVELRAEVTRLQGLADRTRMVFGSRTWSIELADDWVMNVLMTTSAVHARAQARHPRLAETLDRFSPRFTDVISAGPLKVDPVMVTTLMQALGEELLAWMRDGTAYRPAPMTRLPSRPSSNGVVTTAPMNGHAPPAPPAGAEPARPGRRRLDPSERSSEPRAPRSAGGRRARR